MTTRSDLIARLEAAKWGSHELDGLIAIAVTQISDLVNPQSAREQISATAPRYTTSLDAALTLKPEPCPWWRVGKVQAENSPMRAFGHGKSFTAEVGLNWGDVPKLGHADTAPLALCIAALKAREAGR